MDGAFARTPGQSELRAIDGPQLAFNLKLSTAFQLGRPIVSRKDRLFWFGSPYNNKLNRKSSGNQL